MTKQANSDGLTEELDQKQWADFMIAFLIIADPKVRRKVLADIISASKRQLRRN